jgi:hypothetical protein
MLALYSTSQLLVTSVHQEVLDLQVEIINIFMAAMTNITNL